MTTQLTPIIASFNGGELSPRMLGRVDQKIYQIATAEMLNFVPTLEGPAMKRSGFRHIRAADPTSTWLGTFTFSLTQAYVLEWAQLKLRFYTNGGRVETAPGVAYEVTTPYTAAEAPFVSTQQNYDRLYMWHGSHPPASLLRTGATTFSYATLTLKSGPFGDQNTNEAITVTVAGALEVGGVVTITASSAIFLAGHVGASMLIEAADFSDILAWEPGVKTILKDASSAIVVGVFVRSDGKVYECVSLGGSKYTGSVQPTHTRGSEWDGSKSTPRGSDDNSNGGVQWAYRYDRFGVVTITAFGSGTSVTATVTRRLAASLTTVPSFRWSLPAISAAVGWPKVGLLAFGRLIMFTDFEIMASVVGDYGGGTVNMAPFSESGLLAPDMAFRKRLAISNPILWAKEDRDVILLGTSDGTYAIRKVNSNQIFSSDNIECVKQSKRGCSRVWPEQNDTSTVFIQRGGRKLREAGYSLDSDRYVAPNINVWQRHILKGGAVQLAFQGEPEELLWAVRGDGQLALHPHVPEQETRGFARLTHAAGAILSTCVVPSQDGAIDELWALVRRSSDGYLSIEQQAPGWVEEETELADAFYVDSGATYSGSPTRTISGLNHLAGREVAVLAGGAVIPGCSVDGGGNLTPPLPITATTVHVGLGYSARLRLLRPEVQDGGGNTIQGKRKRLVGIVLRLLETVGIKVDPGTGHADELIDRPGSAAMDRPVPVFTGDTASKSLSGDWNRDAQGTIISDDPLPCMVLATMPKIEVGS
jgi:hypothetical protein